MQVLAAAVDAHAGLGDRAGFARRVEHVLLAPGTRLVVAQEDSLRAITPAQRSAESTRGRTYAAGQREYLLGQSAHHEDQCIERVDAVRTQPGSRPVRRRRRDLGLVQHRLAHAPTGLAGARAYRLQ